MKIFKVVKSDGDWLAFADKEKAEKELAFCREMELDSGGDLSFTIEECEMSEDEYKNLPEHDGW